MRQNSVISKTTFGSSISEMSFSSDTLGGYRYGFNNQEKDDEVAGKGDYYAFENRIHDARLGRFLSIDPLTAKFPFYTPYCFAANSPIYFLDALGNEPATGVGGGPPRYGQRTGRRGLADNNNRPIVTTYNTSRVTLALQNANSNNKNNNKILRPPSLNTQTSPPVYAQFNLGHEGGMSTAGSIDYYSGLLDVKNIAIQIKDLFFIETIKTNSQGISSVFVTAGLDKQSQSYKDLEVKENQWQNGLNVELQKIYATEPKFNQSEYDKLKTEDEKKAYKENFNKQKTEYILNLQNRVAAAKMIYELKNGKSPEAIFQEKAIEVYDKNKDNLTPVSTEEFVQPVLYAKPQPSP